MFTQLRQAVSIRFEIIDEVHLVQTEFSLEVLRIDDPRQVGCLHAPFMDWTGNTKAGGRDVVFRLRSEFKYSRIEASITTAMFDLFNNRMQPPVFLFEVCKPRAGSTDVAGQDYAQSLRLPLLVEKSGDCVIGS